MKRGFTLIELLAVIVIIAIISLIAYPTITGIVERTKKEAFKESVNNLILAGENYIIKYSADHQGEGLTYPVTFICNGESCINSDNDKLPFKGKVPSDGNLIIRGEKDIYAEYISDGKYCVSGTKGNLQIYSNCDDIDVTVPIINLSFNYHDTIKIDASDKSGVGDYCVTPTNDVKTCSWISNTSNSVSYRLSEVNASTYYVFVKDKKGNIGSKELAIVPCPYDVNASWDFNYKAETQTFNAVCPGVYKLEVWGAQGGGVESVPGGKGGYSLGYKSLNSGDNLYVMTGGTGVIPAGGTNGGGDGGNGNDRSGWGGGGATHIALNNNRGELKNYVDNKNEVLIVAGGGGGTNSHGTVGAGGGLNGQNSTNHNGATFAGGTQTDGYAFGQGEKGSDWTCGHVNYGADAKPGGGGGWYGGHAIQVCDWGSSGGGAGGSGYIGGVPEFTYNSNTYTPSTETGIREGNGFARITYVAY